MPSRLRPTHSVAAEAILVGDPGRALLLAQELLEQPKMCNHARGLWGYTGTAPSSQALTIQSTGMGGPSAALVLADLAELGVRRAVRIGTCAAIEPEPEPGDLLAVLEARPWGAGRHGDTLLTDTRLTGQLRKELGGGRAIRPAIVASLDFLHESDSAAAGEYSDGVDAVDMQTAALLATGERKGVTVAAILVVAESAAGETADDEALAAAAKRAGAAAATVLSA
ncbi:MAG TPA: hypothetical protein VGO66_06285 [Solirubrobacterales bacterium]|jgi:uridine phosphorylase|nr:hypothetical protein [Solirubrobacterales bacterium]